MNKYKSLIEKINNHLDKISLYDNSSFEILSKAQRYSLMSGGKHLRALILLQTASIGKINVDDILDFASAIEMVHTYSLIHDDLPEMDNDDLRRGVATCHKKFGADIALLAGDALLTKAFNVIANNSSFSSDIKLECIKILSDACGEKGMLAGQTIDKISENKKISYEQLSELHSRKTGDMFLASVKMGCVLGNVDCKTSRLLEQYMSLLGIAFQIKDDILDVTSTREQLGKPINSDIECQKSTFVSLFGLEKSKELLNEKIKQALEIAKQINNQFFVDLAIFFEQRTM